MGTLPDQPCHACRARCSPGKDHCAQHPPKAQAENAAEKSYDRARSRTAERKFYNSAAWAECTKLVKTYNPQCQRLLDDGTQCTHPPQATHHLRDPKDAPHLKLNWANLVAVCNQHHSGGQRGETQGEKYVHTIGPMESVYKHAGHDGGFPEWHKRYQKPAVATLDAAPAELLPFAGRTTFLGDDALDAALAAVD